MTEVQCPFDIYNVLDTQTAPGVLPSSLSLGSCLFSTLLIYLSEDCATAKTAQLAHNVNPAQYLKVVQKLTVDNTPYLNDLQYFTIFYRHFKILE